LALPGHHPCGRKGAIIARPEQIPAVGAGFRRIIRATRLGAYATD
jgi:hypothetical protein